MVLGSGGTLAWIIAGTSDVLIGSLDLEEDVDSSFSL
jgi:hypothetical protein